MIYSGIDWSGDPGDPDKTGMSPELTIAMAQIDGGELEVLTAALADIRRGRRLSEQFAFRYSACSTEVRLAFFTRLAPVSVSVTAVSIDKRNWYAQSRPGRPSEWLDQAIAELVCAAAPSTITGQVILVDRPKSETKAVRATERVIKRALKGAELQPYPQIKPCPDHKSQGHIIQVADMFAGALRDQGPSCRYFQGFSKRLVLV